MGLTCQLVNIIPPGSQGSHAFGPFKLLGRKPCNGSPGICLDDGTILNDFPPEMAENVQSFIGDDLGSQQLIVINKIIIECIGNYCSGIPVRAREFGFPRRYL